MFRSVLITSGPTIEPIDPVRFISNRSSGKTGYYIAKEAIERKIEEIIFITGPVCTIPDKVRYFRVETAEEMRAKVLEYRQNVDVIIMAAAVCDFKANFYSQEKIKKKNDKIVLELGKNPDIIQEIGMGKRENQILVGFAAETEDIFENARRKIKKKRIDLLVLNEISPANPAFDVDFNQVYLITSEEIKKLPVMLKSQIAVQLWDKIFEIKKAKAI